MKKNNKKGFTLAELLIVVAIIAVLTAIAIPVFSAQLEKAQIATEQANARSAYGEAVATYLTLDPEEMTATWSADAITIKGITYTASTTNSGDTWTVALTGTSVKSNPASYTFPEST